MNLLLLEVPVRDTPHDPDIKTTPRDELTEDTP